ncbi:hypothetical protein K5D38_08320, partial [Pseudomonas cichorii]|nr:hypothetical protein [Pseudomonas cichorii]
MQWNLSIWTAKNRHNGGLMDQINFQSSLQTATLIPDQTHAGCWLPNKPQRAAAFSSYFDTLQSLRQLPDPKTFSPEQHHIAIMRKKLHTFLWITCDQFSTHHANQGLQRSAQEVAQWCATS